MHAQVVCYGPRHLGAIHAASCQGSAGSSNLTAAASTGVHWNQLNLHRTINKASEASGVQGGLQRGDVCVKRLHVLCKSIDVAAPPTPLWSFGGPCEASPQIPCSCGLPWLIPAGQIWHLLLAAAAAVRLPRRDGSALRPGWLQWLLSPCGSLLSGHLWQVASFAQHLQKHEKRDR